MYNRVVPEQKLDYIHNNPVKAGLCQLPEEYKYSSAGYYILNAPNEILTQTWSIYNPFNRLQWKWCGDNTDHRLK
jgi:hypothetical protein